jgi:hypothetical protein
VASFGLHALITATTVETADFLHIAASLLASGLIHQAIVMLCYGGK